MMWRFLSCGSMDFARQCGAFLCEMNGLLGGRVGVGGFGVWGFAFLVLGGRGMCGDGVVFGRVRVGGDSMLEESSVEAIRIKTIR